MAPYADHLFEIPAVSTLLQPLLSTIPLQVFAAGVAPGPRLRRRQTAQPGQVRHRRVAAIDLAVPQVNVAPRWSRGKLGGFVSTDAFDHFLAIYRDGMAQLPPFDARNDVTTSFGTVRAYRFDGPAGTPVVLLPGRNASTPMYRTNLPSLLRAAHRLQHRPAGRSRSVRAADPDRGPRRPRTVAGRDVGRARAEAGASAGRVHRRVDGGQLRCPAPEPGRVAHAVGPRDDVRAGSRPRRWWRPLGCMRQASRRRCGGEY